MAKTIVAKTNIKYGKTDGESIEITAGSEVDAQGLGMTKKQLEQLYDVGAIELQETADVEKKSDETSDSQENTPPVKSTPTKATPTKAASSGTGNAT